MPATQLDIPNFGLPENWRDLRKAVIRALAAHAHRHAGIWKPCRVELSVPRLWASTLEQHQKNINEFKYLCEHFARAGMAYRVAVTSAEVPALSVY